MQYRSLSEIQGYEPPGAVFPSPVDWRDQFIYFLMVDRFRNDDDAIPPYDWEHPESAPRGRDPQVGGTRRGGTLRGIIRRLDYIRNVGATALWLSPVLKARVDKPEDYHGYAIQNYLEVDPHLGTLNDLQELVRQAHARDMYVVMDIVINHTADNWTYEGGQSMPYRAEPYPFGSWRRVEGSDGEELGEDDAVWPVEFQNPDWYKRRGEIQNWMDPVQAIDGDFMSLKTFNTENHDTLGGLVSVYKYWIAAADIDGYRVDAVKHVEDTAAAIICNGLREYAQSIGKGNFFIFGEIVGGDDIIDRYLGRRAGVAGPTEPLKSLDASLDFPQYFILEEVIKGIAPPMALIERFERLSASYTDRGEAAYYFVTFLENHDQIARPCRRFMHGNSIREQVILAMGYLLTSKGIPCLYYGTEQAFDGGGPGTEYVRECMFGDDWGAFDTTGVHFFNDLHPVYRAVKQVADIRAANPALRYGRMHFRDISGDGEHFGRPQGPQSTLAYSRILDVDEMLIAINLSWERREDYIVLDPLFSPAGSEMMDLIRQREPLIVQECPAGVCVRVPLEPYSMAVLQCRGSSEDRA